ncbi:MAG: penicillin-binding protein activator, partial [Halomonas sp.]
MKQSLRGVLATGLLALLMTGCAMQSPSVVDRADDQEAGRLLNQAEQQAPDQAAKTRLEAATIFAQQGQRQRAFETADALDEVRLSDTDRVRWALLFSELARGMDNPRAVLRATQVLNDDLPIQDDQRETLTERQRWARTALDEPDMEQLTLPSLEGQDISRIIVALPESGPL